MTNAVFLGRTVAVELYKQPKPSRRHSGGVINPKEVWLQSYRLNLRWRGQTLRNCKWQVCAVCPVFVRNRQSLITRVVKPSVCALVQRHWFNLQTNSITTRIAISVSEVERQGTNAPEISEHRWDLKSVWTGGLETRHDKDWTSSWADYCHGKDYNLLCFFFPYKGYDLLSVIVVTVRRQGGWSQVAGHGAELTRQELSILGPRLIRELH